MLIDLGGHTALVTGGSDGLGKAIAARLAQSGANVAIVARNAENLAAAAADIEAGAKGRVVWHSCDLADNAAAVATGDKVKRELGPVDILVNNAGGAARRAFDELTPADFVEDFQVKVFAALTLAQSVVPDMKAKRWGRIINILSSRARAPDAGSAPSTTARAAGMSLTKVWSLELAPWNILVNALCAGLISSGQWRRRHLQQAPGIPYDDYLKQQAERACIPLGRMGTAQEMANVACFLASDAASYVTGAAISVDGGLCPIT